MNTRPYIGLPFADQGRGPDAWDCWGLIRHVYWHEYGIELPSYTECYGSALEHAEVTALIEYGRANWRVVTDPTEGDLVILRLHGDPWHVGLVVAPGRMLHIHRRTASVVEAFNGMIWRNRVQEFLRWDG